MNRHGQTVCLTMIVKDEAAVIRRCLDSVRPVIDRWAIVDTGSTDGTQDVVREHLSDIPGTLLERPWVDFGHNRNEAIALARGSANYLFMIDADEVLELDDGLKLPRLEADSYTAEVQYGGWTYLRKVLVQAALPWRYLGVVHEYLECVSARTEGSLSGLRTRSYRDGARARDPQTYARDALAIERALLDEPGNARYVFYLAQSYREAGDFEAAIRTFERRVEMGGSPEEVWYSLYQVGQLKERLGRPWPEVMDAYLAAHERMPDRAEPLFWIGAGYWRRGRHRSAHRFLTRAMEIPRPRPGRIFVERVVYDRLGDYAAAIQARRLTSRAEIRPEPPRRPAFAGSAEPKVSCLLVTGDRVMRAKRAIRSYAEQTHHSRELVVVTDAGSHVHRSLERYARSLGLHDVRFVVLDGGPHPLGRLRNASLEAARGDVVCQWDDDDYSHPERLERQLAHMRDSGACACFLTDHLHLHEDRCELFWVDWTGGGTIAGSARLAPGTLMMDAGLDARYPETGPYATRGEDSALLAGLDGRGPIAALTGAGHLWLYAYHGANTFPEEHHRRLSSFGFPRQRLVERETEIRVALSSYPIPSRTVVAGPDGPAFVVRGSAGNAG